MYKNKTIAVVVPAFNEESQIRIVIETMPEFVDRIIIVDDNSTDNTFSEAKKIINSQNRMVKLPEYNNDIDKNRFNNAEVIVRELNEKEKALFTPHEIIYKMTDSKIILLKHKVNAGVGAAIATGYKWCKDNNIDCTAVMAGDAQMDPAELESIIKPVIEEGIDYVKGNRLNHGSSWYVIPKIRFLGNSVLSILTKIASGYYHVSDTQAGYTAISKRALNSIQLFKIYKRYGMPNDMLVKLNIAQCTIKEVNIKPVYNVGERSKMKLLKVIPRISILLVKSFYRRIWIKYLIKDFHPLFILYHLSMVLGLASIPYAVKIITGFIDGITVGFGPILAFIFLTISGFQSLLFSMLMDIQDNERLYK